MTRPWLAAAAGAWLGCSAAPPAPATLDTRGDACAACRMAVSEARYASQLVAQGELPRFFDDLGCLGAFVKSGRAPQGATAFVADHRTRAWVRADLAVYTRARGLSTPMGSHLIAHANSASRDQDPAARGGEPLAPEDLFGPAGAPAGAPR